MGTTVQTDMEIGGVTAAYKLKNKMKRWLVRTGIPICPSEDPTNKMVVRYVAGAGMMVPARNAMDPAIAKMRTAGRFKFKPVTKSMD